MTDQRELSEQDICTQYVLPALLKSGWDVSKQVREQVYFTDGKFF
ncbi:MULTISPECIES: hypothetical protein [unclassified Nostoc]|nr:hypothetical protein [Nostoc sp. S13]MDF5739408.1 hypothetical protein [Nostoc sp. S13]